MPSVLWTDPKTWVEGERVSANELSQQLSDNITWLYERNIDVSQVSGVSDYLSPNVNQWSTIGVLRCTLNKERDETLIRTCFSGGIAHSQYGGIVWLDVLIDNSYYASSLTPTPLTDGISSLRGLGSLYTMNTKFDFYIPNILSGVHEFRMQWKTNLTQASLNVTNTIAQFSVEEYGVANVSDI